MMCPLSGEMDSRENITVEFRAAALTDRGLVDESRFHEPA